MRVSNIVPLGPRNRAPGLIDIAIVSIAALSGGILLVVAAWASGLVDIRRSSPLDTAVVIASQSVGFILGIALVGWGLRKLSWRALGLTPVSTRAVVNAILLAIIAYALVLFVVDFFAPGAESAMRDIFAKGRPTIPGVVASVAAAAILAPTAEELWFRGLVYRGLEGKCGHWSASLISSLFFGLAHFQTTLPIWPATTFLLGLLLSRMTKVHRSILPAIAFHAIYNFIGMSTIMRSAMAH